MQENVYRELAQRLDALPNGVPATESGLAERFIRTLKEEHIDYTEYHDFDDAFEQLAHWLEVEYMTECIHSALGCLTPAEFEARLGISQPNPLLLQA